MFYQHQPLVYWTSDRGLWRAAGMPSPLPRPARGFYRCQTWGTKGSAQIRHLHTKHKGVMSRKETHEAELLVQEQRGGLYPRKLRPVDSSLADQDLSDPWSTQMPTVVFVIIVFVEHCEPISETNIDST